MQVDTNPVTSGFDDLKSQLLQKKAEPKKESPKETVLVENSKGSELKPSSAPAPKKMVFRKGDQTYELDEDTEFEMTADKRPVKLTLRELKERAAGDIAVKSRMHSLAEERKAVQATLNEFARLAKDDPLGALEYISTKAAESDSEFEYKKYLNALAEQAEKLGEMDERDLKTYELEKKLNKTEKDLSMKERETAVVLRKQEILSEFPEIGDQQFGEMVDAVLANPELSEGLETEHDVLDMAEELIRETLTQRDIISLINEINPIYASDNDLIFSLSDQLKQNPDLDEADIRDIIHEVILPQERQRASRVLSDKQRGSVPIEHLRSQGASDYDLLQQQLIERNQKQKSSR